MITSKQLTSLYALPNLAEVLRRWSLFEKQVIMERKGKREKEGEKGRKREKENQMDEKSIYC